MNRYVFGEALGWTVGLVGVGFILWTVWVSTSGQVTFGGLIGSVARFVGGAVVSVVGVAIAVTSREHRGAGHATHPDRPEPPGRDDDS